MAEHRPLFKKVFGWLLLLVGLAAAAGFLVLTFNGCLFGGLSEWGVTIAGLTFAVIGWILTYYRGDNRLSWLIAWIGAGLPFMVFINSYLPCAATNNLTFLDLDLIIILSQIVPVLVIPPLFILLPALFPDGHFLSPTWRRTFTLLLFTLALTVIIFNLQPGPVLHYLADEMVIENPIGITWPWFVSLRSVFESGMFLLISLGSLLAVISFIIRFRDSTGETRQQFKWFAAFLASVVTIYIIGYEILGLFFYPEIFEHWTYPVIITLSFMGFPIIIGITIFKYRLYDIDIIIRRTLVYSLVTLALILVYFGSVVSLQRLFTAISGQQSPLAIVISTLLIAALFNPLRHRVQAVIDRRFYRKKYDAQQVLAEFAQTARDETDIELVITELAQAVQETIQPELVGIWLKTDDS